MKSDPYICYSTHGGPTSPEEEILAANDHRLIAEHLRALAAEHNTAANHHHAVAHRKGESNVL